MDCGGGKLFHLWHLDLTHLPLCTLFLYSYKPCSFTAKPPVAYCQCCLVRVITGALPAWLTGRFCRGQFHDVWGTSGVVLVQRRCWRLHLAMAGVSWEVCFGFYVHNLSNQTASNPKLWPSRKSSLVHKERCTPKGVLFRNEVLNSLFSDLPSHRIVINRCPSTSEHLGKRVSFKANSIFWQIAFLKKRDKKAHVGQLYSRFLQLARSPKPNGMIYFSMSGGILVLLLKKIKA